MTPVRIEKISSAVLVAAGMLLFVDLFLNWQQVTVQTPLGSVTAATTGFHGTVGIVLGIVVGMVTLIEGLRLGGQVAETAVPSFLPLAATVAVLGLTVTQFIDSETLNVGGIVDVQTGARTWSAWAGLALAIVMFASALVRFAIEILEDHPTTQPERHARAAG